MLKIHDNLNPAECHDFRLSKIDYSSSWDFILTSSSQPNFFLTFTIPYSDSTFHDGYSTSIYLVKNKFFAQKDVVEVRINENPSDNGRIGYIVQLNSLFDTTILTLNKHLFSFVYYALGNIFFNSDFKQTKAPSFLKSVFTITDFFDDDILLLIICDQVVSKIPNFKLENYFPALYKRGFYLHNDNWATQFLNSSTKVSDNFADIYSNKNKFNYYSLKLEKVSTALYNEDYIDILFKKQLLIKNDPETRFLLLYQIIELLISQILTLELNKKVCSNPTPLQSFELKNSIDEITKELHRISLLLNPPYTKINPLIVEDLKSEIYSLLQILNFPSYQAPYDTNKVNFAGIFYDYRNKLLHTHRSFKSPGLNEPDILIRMSSINSLVELLTIDILTSYAP